MAVAPIARCPQHGFHEVDFEVGPGTAVTMDQSRSLCPWCGREVPILDATYRGGGGGVEQEVLEALVEGLWSRGRASSLAGVLATVRSSTPDQLEQAMLQVASAEPALASLLLDKPRQGWSREEVVALVDVLQHVARSLRELTAARTREVPPERLSQLVQAALAAQPGGALPSTL